MGVLVEIRVLVAADDMAHGELLLGAVGDTLTALVGEDRYGAVLFEGINPNGTEVPEGFAVVEETEADKLYRETERYNRGGDEVRGVPV